jgi:hypothetical protein
VSSYTIDDVITLAEALGEASGPGPGGDIRCRCPAHHDENPSLSLKIGDDGQLLVHCFTGCAARDIYVALETEGLWPPVKSAADDSAEPEEEISGEPAEDPAEAATKARAEEKAKKLAELRARFKAGWEALDAKSALHATVDTYCDWRGISRFKTAPEWLRFTPFGSHISKDKHGVRFEQFFPTLIVAGTHPVTGELLGGQREYLGYGGKGFAPVSKKERRKTAPGCSLKGAIARLAEPLDGEFLIVGEGWVTVRTVMHATDLPGWSVFGVDGLASFDPPDNVKSVILLAENDTPKRSRRRFRDCWSAD